MLRNAIARGLGDLGRPQFVRYVLFGVIGAALVFLALFGGIGWLLVNTALLSIAWLEWALDALGGLAVLVLSVVLYPGVVAAVAQLFAEAIADDVEKQHYPALPPAGDTPLITGILAGLRLVGISLVLNLLALPLYLVPGLNLPVFVLLNGYLVGREYFEAVALRRFSEGEVQRLRKASGGRVLILGAAVAFGLGVPLLNLIMPVLGLVVMAHLAAQLAQNRERRS